MAKIKTNSNRNSNSEGRGQSGLRARNERRILALIRKHGSAPKAEIAQELGLSAQAVTVIIKSLEKENLLLRSRIKKL